jgi:hypothetical protein
LDHADNKKHHTDFLASPNTPRSSERRSEATDASGRALPEPDLEYCSNLAISHPLLL